MNKIIWALFGNDEDGPYGPPSLSYPHTWWGAVRAWCRNPCHNLLFHVLAWKGGPFLRLGKRPGLNFYIGFRPDSGAFGIKLVYEKN